jgi:glycosyltransferase involved in cell wall biosynthesis
MISVLVLTYNEEVNIEDCIRSIPWRSDVHVLDSNSTDHTRDIAMSLGAKVSRRTFDDYARQRAAGLALPFANSWIVMLDADERMTPELAAEIESAIATCGPGVGMMRVRRKDYFMSRWLRRSSGYPTWFPRVMRKGAVQVQRRVNETYSCEGETMGLQHHLLHYPFNKGLDWWFERHNHYARSEAVLAAAERGARVPLGDILAGEPGRRRRALKALAYRLPGRSWATFFYLYVLRLGFLDGAAGYRYATMRLAYELMIDAKSAGLKAGLRD